MTLPIPIALVLPTARPLPGPSLFSQVTFMRMLMAVVLLVIAWLAIRYLSKLLDYLGSQSHRARFVVRWVQPVVRIALWFGALLASFYLLAPTERMFLAGLGSAAIAVGLGAQDLVKNLLGGLVILGDRPFQIGDRVKIGDTYGEIKQIGLVSLDVVTPDDNTVSIPNSMILSSGVSNANSGATDCQVVTDLFLPPATDPKLAQQIGYEAAHSSRYLLPSKDVVVLVSDVFDQLPYLRLRIKAYVYDHRFEPAMQSDITIRVKTEFLRLGLLDDWRESSAEYTPPD